MSVSLFCCVFAPHLLVQVVLRQMDTPRLAFVVASGPSDRATVIDLGARAAAAGVRAGMPIRDARRVCPTLRVVPADPALLDRSTARVEEVLAGHADAIRTVGPGTWILPLRALGAQYRCAEEIGTGIRHDVLAVAEVQCAVGIAPGPALARIAAHVAAARGRPVLVVRPGAEAAFLAPLPVRVLPRVGTQTVQALRRLGVTSVGELAAVPVAVLVQLVGPRGQALAHLARGLETADLEGRVTHVVARWQAADEPTANARHLRGQVQLLTERVGQMLRAQGQAAGAITARVTWVDGTTRHSTSHLAPRCDLDRELVAASRRVCDALLATRRLAVVALAVNAADLGPVQQDLFRDSDARLRQLQQAVDSVRRRYGPRAIQTAALFGLAADGAAAAL